MSDQINKSDLVPPIPASRDTPWVSEDGLVFTRLPNDEWTWMKP